MYTRLTVFCFRCEQQHLTCLINRISMYSVGENILLKLSHGKQMNINSVDFGNLPLCVTNRLWSKIFNHKRNARLKFVFAFFECRNLHLYFKKQVSSCFQNLLKLTMYTLDDFQTKTFLIFFECLIIVYIPPFLSDVMPNYLRAPLQDTIPQPIYL